MFSDLVSWPGRIAARPAVSVVGEPATAPPLSTVCEIDGPLYKR